MRGARHPALSIGAGVPSAALVLVAILASGCGSSGTESPGAGSTETTAPQSAAVQDCAGTSAGVKGLRVSGVGCATGGGVAAGWTAKGACAPPPGASRTSCAVGDYRCLGTATERGLAVSCARPGRSISFVFRRS
jgi:hypothetical protein